MLSGLAVQWSDSREIELSVKATLIHSACEELHASVPSQGNVSHAQLVACGARYCTNLHQITDCPPTHTPTRTLCGNVTVPHSTLDITNMRLSTC